MTLEPEEGDTRYVPADDLMLGAPTTMNTEVLAREATSPVYGVRL